MGSGTIRETHTSLEVVDAPLAALHPHPRNPRTITPARLAQLCRTLDAERDMLRARPIVALPDGTVIAGNQRLAAALELGWETIPTVFADLDDERAVRWMLLDNRGFGADDAGMVAELLAEIEGAGSDLLLTGYEAGETDRLLRAYRLRDKDPDDAPPLPQGEPRSRRGEVYELGPHRLMCGDATSAEDVARLLGGAEPKLLTTDPPYGVLLDMEWRDRAGHNSMAPAERSYMKAVLGKVGISGDNEADWSRAYELVPSLDIAYVWHASSRASAVEEGLERIGFELVQQIIWAKSVFAMSRQHYHWKHEPCWYARRVGAKVPWYGGFKQATVWDAASPKHIMSGSGEERVDHPTQKPAVLYTVPIENHTLEGEAIYEPFAGSGTAIIAAEMTGRRCFGMELDPVFVDVIRDRYEAFVA